MGVSWRSIVVGRRNVWHATIVISALRIACTFRDILPLPVGATAPHCSAVRSC